MKILVLDDVHSWQQCTVGLIQLELPVFFFLNPLANFSWEMLWISYTLLNMSNGYCTFSISK